MRIVFGNWKYIIKNFFFVLPFSLIPALFFGLSLDYAAIREFTIGMFTGTIDLSFATIFRTWSLIRVDSWLGAVSGLFLIGYGLARSTAEFFREPDWVWHLGGIEISAGQTLCLPMILAGIVIMCWAYRTRSAQADISL